MATNKGNRTRVRSSMDGRPPKEPLTKDTLKSMRIRERKVEDKSKKSKSLRIKNAASKRALQKRVATTELPAYQKVHAVFLASMGKINIQKVAKECGIYPNTISVWKKKYKWEEELENLKAAAEDAIQKALTGEARSNGMLYMVTPSQLKEVFAEMTGKQIELGVSELISEIFVEDLRDLAKINKRLRFWLDHVGEDGKESVILPEVLKDIAQTKVTVIKAVRLLFGMDSDNVKKQGDVVMGDKIIEVLVQGPAASSFAQIAQEIEIVQVEKEE